MASNKINIVISAEDKASKPLRAVSDEMDHGSGKADKYSSALSSMGVALGRATLAIGATGLAAAGAGAALGFKFNSSVEQAETKLMAFMKDGEKVAKTLAWVKDEAAATQFSFTDMADAAANLTPVAKTSGQSLESLVKQAEILAALNPTEGLTGATFSLREALSGDWVSIVDRFNLPRKRINELKAEGVPAMEIISRTLQEMGIDYSLVAKQGQTVASRFDQVKDKLTMMAGAAAKPIFDRVKDELSKLGEFDYTALGENLSGVVSGAIEAFDTFIPKVQEVGRQIGDYLGPKFAGLWATISEDIIPIFQDLWHNVIEPLAPVLGEVLVGAIGLVVDALGAILEGLGWMYDKITEGNPIIWGLIGIFGTLAGAMAFNAVFGALNAGFAFLTLTTIPGVMLKIGALQALIATPLVFGAIAVGAAIAAMALIEQAANRARAAVNEAQAATDSLAAERSKITDRFTQVMRDPNSSPELKARWQNAMRSIGRNASGTAFSPGGATLVGENGPEIVNMPRGASVTQAYRTRNELASDGAGGVTNILSGTFTFQNAEAVQEFFNRLDKTQRLAKFGMAS